MHVCWNVCVSVCMITCKKKNMCMWKCPNMFSMYMREHAGMHMCFRWECVCVCWGKGWGGGGGGGCLTLWVNYTYHTQLLRGFNQVLCLTNIIIALTNPVLLLKSLCHAKIKPENAMFLSSATSVHFELKLTLLCQRMPICAPTHPSEVCQRLNSE